MRIQAHTFTAEETNLIGKAIYAYLVEMQDENGEVRSDLNAYYKKEYATLQKILKELY